MWTAGRASDVNANQQHTLVLEAIAQARAASWPGLTLPQCGLTQVPSAVLELEDLETLRLSANAIEEIPHELSGLSQLKYLDLVRNPVRQLPALPGVDLAISWDTFLDCKATLIADHVVSLWLIVGPDQRSEFALRAPECLDEILKLRRLNSLYIGVDGLIHQQPLGLKPPPPPLLPLLEGLSHLPELRHLTLLGMELPSLPHAVRRLSQLVSLTLTGLDLRELPSWLGELNLKRLSARLNLLEDLPRSLRQLENLVALELGENQFSQIPAVIFDLTLLQRLDLSCRSRARTGRIATVPAEVSRLQELTTLRLDGQPVVHPPPEVVVKGALAIRNYWRQQQEAGVDYLAEAKLLIVGEAGAGKTSLSHKLRDHAYQLQPDQCSTQGLEVAPWRFPTAVRTKKPNSESLLPLDFRVNIWDFGGQEVYHATHQFFLTRRSLYLLVTDDRKEDTDFHYWLNAIELRSDNSPVLIVHNEKQDRRREIDLGRLRERFSNLSKTVRINLATNRGLNDLSSEVQRHLESLPHIGVPLPSTWRAVRDALEQDPRDYISLDEYLAICERCGFKRHEDKLQLSSFLHDLGICLHFQDDAALKQTVILKPKWGTDAVHRLLDDSEVVDARGRFTARDMERVWSAAGYASMHPELLRLMMKFQLCYELAEGDAYIAPQLLSADPPHYAWSSSEGLELRYEYAFMPKGLIWRFIVAMHHLIADQALVWKNGVVLERENQRAEVVQDYEHRRIVVRFAGDSPQSLLAVIDEQLTRIHRLFRNLRWEQHLPCRCAKCRRSPTPFSFALSDLRDFAQSGDLIQCRTSRELVNAQGVLQHYFPTALQQTNRETTRPSVTVKIPSRDVYVSYSWAEESRNVVDELEAAMASTGLRLIRDRNDLGYKDRIRAFMQRIGRGESVILVLSRSYFESKSCMFELTEVARDSQFRRRVFPIVLRDADIYDGLGRIKHLRYWEARRSALDKEVRTLGGEYTRSIREELELFVTYRNMMDGIVDVLSDMNTLTAEEHRRSGFEQLIDALQRQAEA
jgi:internalin A